jgi:hypothetical protein
VGVGIYLRSVDTSRGFGQPEICLSSTEFWVEPAKTLSVYGCLGRNFSDLVLSSLQC